MSFQDSKREFTHAVIPDTGSSRTIVAKDLLDRNNIQYGPNTRNEELFNASNSPMTVNGIADLTVTFLGRSLRINALVSEDLKDTVLLAWHDAEKLGSITIARLALNEDLGDPTDRINAVKKKYGTILKDTLSEKPMIGPKMKIHFSKAAIAKGIVPKKIFTAAQTPIHLKKSADEVLAKAIQNKLVEPVPPSEPSEWCARGFFVRKHDGSARLVVDLSHLNKIIERPVHPFIAGNDLLKNLDPNSRVFCKLDAVMGYFQIPLDENSQKLTTFCYLLAGTDT